MKNTSNPTSSSASQKRKLSNLAIGAACLSSLALSGAVYAASPERGEMWYGGSDAMQPVSGMVSAKDRTVAYTMSSDNGKMSSGDKVVESGVQDIVDTAVGAGQFSTLIAAVQEAGLVETLKGEGPFTVFAPTDEAFSKIPADQLQALLADKEALTAVLTYHVVPGKVLAADVVALDSATTVQGSDINIDTRNGVRVDSANVVVTDIVASNGVIHVIDTVIMPQISAQL